MTVADGNGALILVVDDEPELREILREEFEYFGYSVMEAANGRVALEILEQHPIEVIVTDIRMPGGNGLEFLKKVLEHVGQRPPVILVSAFADISGKDALALGAFAYLTKPYVLEDLMKITAEALAVKKRN